MSTKHARSLDDRERASTLRGSVVLSLADQIRGAVEAVGSQAELCRIIARKGGSLTRARLSNLCGGQRPSVDTLADIAGATGRIIQIGPSTDVGVARPSHPCEQSS